MFLCICAEDRWCCVQSTGTSTATVAQWMRSVRWWQCITCSFSGCPAAVYVGGKREDTAVLCARFDGVCSHAPGEEAGILRRITCDRVVEEQRVLIAEEAPGMVGCGSSALHGLLLQRFAAANATGNCSQFGTTHDALNRVRCRCYFWLLSTCLLLLHMHVTQ